MRQLKHLKMTPRTHQPNCRCPVCRSARGERVRGENSSKVMVSMRLERDLVERLRATATAEGMSQAELVELVLRDYLGKR